MTRIVEVDEMLSAMELTRMHLLDLLEECYEEGMENDELLTAITVLDREIKVFEET